jgi:HlyD family secretion protein
VRRRTIVLAGAALALAAGLAGARWATRPRETVDTAAAVREDFRIVLEATGKVDAARAFDVGPPAVKDEWDYDLAWLIPDGSRVKEGDVVARFDATTVEERLREFQAQLTTARQEREKEQRSLDLSLRQMKLDLVKAEGELQVADVELQVPADLRSSIEVEELRLRRELALQKAAFLRSKIEFETELVRSKLELLDVKARFAEGKIAYSEEARAKYHVKAPTQGLVQHLPKPRGGERWEVGERVWMLAKILRVADLSTLRVEAWVLEADAAEMRVGQPAEITVDAIPGRVIASRVAELGGMVHEKSAQDPTRVLDAYLPLEGEGLDDLRPGMTLRVRIETTKLPDRLTVPLRAVRAGDGGHWVEVSAGGGRAERRRIEIGPRNRDRVVVTSGLAAGETVVVSRRAHGTGA